MEDGLPRVKAVVDADIEARDGRVILLNRFFEPVQKYVCIGFFCVRQAEVIRGVPLGDDEQVAVRDRVLVTEDNAGAVLGDRLGIGDEFAENTAVVLGVVVRQNEIPPVLRHG